MLKRADAEQSGPRSVPQRIADAIDYDIAAQGYGIGERLIETQLAEQYGTSRGSVREALRILATRGSVELASGRGGVVRGYSLDQIADAFAAAGMLMALAVRYIAQQRGAAVLARIGERADRLERMLERGFSPPLEFATTLGGFTAAIVVGSGNHYVRSQMSVILNRSVWRAMWEHPCDHLTFDRQREVLVSVRAIQAAMSGGDVDGAEREFRVFHQRHCDAVLTELARQRGERPPASPPLVRAGPTGDDPDRLESRLTQVEAAVEALRRQAADAVA